MSNPGTESAVALVFTQMLSAVAISRSLQLVAASGTSDLDPQRIVITALDQGEELSLKGSSGQYGRRLEVTINLHASADDQTGEWMDATVAAVEAALKPPYSPLPALANFQCFVIYEFGAHNLQFDKCNWLKQFTIQMAALL